MIIAIRNDKSGCNCYFSVVSTANLCVAWYNFCFRLKQFKIVCLEPSSFIPFKQSNLVVSSDFFFFSRTLNIIWTNWVTEFHRDYSSNFVQSASSALNNHRFAYHLHPVNALTVWRLRAIGSSNLQIDTDKLIKTVLVLKVVSRWKPTTCTIVNCYTGRANGISRFFPSSAKLIAMKVKGRKSI